MQPKSIWNFPLQNESSASQHATGMVLKDKAAVMMLTAVKRGRS